MFSTVEMRNSLLYLETTIENNPFFKLYIIILFILDQTSFLNRALSTLHGGSLEIMLIFPLNLILSESNTCLMNSRLGKQIKAQNSS